MAVRTLRASMIVRAGLMACDLQEENEEMGKELAQGKVHGLEQQARMLCSVLLCWQFTLHRVQCFSSACVPAVNGLPVSAMTI